MTMSATRATAIVKTTPATSATTTTKTMGATMRSRRIELGMSQAELSEQLGLSRTKISAIENGRFGSARILLEVADALGLEALMLPRQSPEARAIRNAQAHNLERAVGARVKRSTHE